MWWPNRVWKVKVVLVLNTNGMLVVGKSLMWVLATQEIQHLFVTQRRGMWQSLIDVLSDVAGFVFAGCSFVGIPLGNVLRKKINYVLDVTRDLATGY
jgi:ABC-type proline/glycine betaine transport system permease subunit